MAYGNTEIKICPDHPGTLYPSVNQFGEQIMVFDPHQPSRSGFPPLVRERLSSRVSIDKGGLRFINGHSLKFVEDSWPCAKCGHIFNDYRDARDFKCGDDCTEYHPLGTWYGE